MGFGLFVPEFRAEFGLSSSTVGFVSSLGFFGFLLGLLVAQAVLQRKGPAAAVLWGLIAATVGLGLVAVAPGLPVLALGVFLAASSAGFVWTPFNDAVHRKVSGLDRPTALSRISTGTSVGIAGAGVTALAMALAGLPWRVCWGLFAVMSAVAFLANLAGLRGVEAPRADICPPLWRDVLQGEAWPLFAVAFIYGTTSAIYIAFAADHMWGGGGVPGLPAETTPALIFVVYGVFGFAGLLTGRIRRAIGLPWLLRLLMLVGALSLALASVGGGSWGGLIGSAGLQGLHVMMTSAVLAFWSERLFPAVPSLGFTAALLAMAGGSVLGPAVAGVAEEVFGNVAMFLGVAALPAVFAVLLRDLHIQEDPVRTMAAA